MNPIIPVSNPPFGAIDVAWEVRGYALSLAVRDEGFDGSAIEVAAMEGWGNRLNREMGSAY